MAVAGAGVAVVVGDSVMRDYLNELAIRAAMRAHLFGYWLQRRAAEWHRCRINARSAAQVARMEKGRGLTPGP